jgi:hypothetical protein
LPVDPAACYGIAAILCSEHFHMPVRYADKWKKTKSRQVSKLADEILWYRVHFSLFPLLVTVFLLP